MRANRRILLQLAGLSIAALVSGAVIATFSSDEAAQRRSISRLESPSVGLGKAQRPLQKELVLVYLGSSTCAWSRHLDLPSLVAMAKASIGDQAAIASASFSTLGVAVDWSIQEGLYHLSGFGEFDEISIGRKWYGMGPRRYIWSDIPGPGGTPQLLVVERTRQLDPSTQEVTLEFQSERLLVRKVGVDEIRSWVEGGSILRGYSGIGK